MPGVRLIPAAFFNSNMFNPASSRSQVAFLVLSFTTFFLYGSHLMGAYYIPGTIELLHALTRLLQTFPPAPGCLPLLYLWGRHLTCPMQFPSPISPFQRFLWPCSLEQFPVVFLGNPTYSSIAFIPRSHHASFCALAA